MDICELDLTNERLVLEALAIHCTYPQEWAEDFTQSAGCVAQNLAKLNSRHPKVVFYVQDHGRIIALHWAEVPMRRLGHIRSLWIDPLYRRRGLATRLKQTAEAWFLEQGVERIETEVDASNAPMKALNARFGFEAIGDKYVKSLVGESPLGMRLGSAAAV